MNKFSKRSRIDPSFHVYNAHKEATVAFSKDLFVKFVLLTRRFPRNSNQGSQDFA